MLTYVADSCVGVFDKVTMLSLYTEDIEFRMDSSVEAIYLPGLLKFPTQRRSVYRKIRDTLFLIRLLRIELTRIKPDLVCSFGVNCIFLCVLSTLGLGIKTVGSERRSPADLNYFWKKISRRVYATCNGMVFQLEDAKNYYNQRISNNAVVIPNPYLSEKEYIPCNAENREKTITAAAARFEYQKGFDTLIKAFGLVREKHNDFQLIIYGKGDPDEYYGELIESLNLKTSIEFPGLVKNVADAVYSSSVFVLPSRFEGIPNTLLEVMGAGVPTVSCDCPPGGPKFLTDGGRRGLLVPVDDYEALAKAICRIIENESLAAQLSNDSLEIRKELQPDVISKKWTDYFINVLNERRSGLFK